MLAPKPPLPPPVAVAPRPPAPASLVLRPAPEELQRPDAATGLPPGWYVPDPPTAPEPQPQTETGGTARVQPVEAPPPRTTPELRTRALLRDFPWVAGFWSELQPQERARAERAFARRGDREGLSELWDRMGLQDRVLLLFGPGRSG
ncbi:hypothetical protein [Falsiroseomonas sp.]|uniref:hypothetical protein n=1 Tax=Falsiroseomonas sp. TaxID=2870721 RepID=UPI003561F517